MKHHSKLLQAPSVENEKAPRDLENVDLSKNDGNAQNDIVDKIKSVPYEDALTNLAYTDTEGELADEEAKNSESSTTECQKIENK